MGAAGSGERVERGAPRMRNPSIPPASACGMEGYGLAGGGWWPAGLALDHDGEGEGHGDPLVVESGGFKAELANSGEDGFVQSHGSRFDDCDVLGLAARVYVELQNHLGLVGDEIGRAHV